MNKDNEIKQTLDAVTEVVRELRMSHGPSPGTSNIMVNGGGVGVWIATVCCALMLGITIIGAMVILDQSRQIAELRQDGKETRSFVTAIYAMAPTLNPAHKPEQQAEE